MAEMTPSPIYLFIFFHIFRGQRPEKTHEDISHALATQRPVVLARNVANAQLAGRHLSRNQFRRFIVIYRYTGNTIEERLEVSLWVHERQPTGQVMNQVMPASKAYGTSPPRKATLLV